MTIYILPENSELLIVYVLYHKTFKTNGYYNKKLQSLGLNVFSANFNSSDMGACSIWEFLYIFHLREVLIYIFPSNQGANFSRGSIIEALRYKNADTILYSDVLFITLLNMIVITSDDQIDDYKSDGNISDKKNLR